MCNFNAKSLKALIFSFAKIGPLLKIVNQNLKPKEIDLGDMALFHTVLISPYPDPVVN